MRLLEWSQGHRSQGCLVLKGQVQDLLAPKNLGLPSAHQSSKELFSEGAFKCSALPRHGSESRAGSAVFEVGAGSRRVSEVGFSWTRGFIVH